MSFSIHYKQKKTVLLFSKHESIVNIILHLKLLLCQSACGLVGLSCCIILNIRVVCENPNKICLWCYIYIDLEFGMNWLGIGCIACMNVETFDCFPFGGCVWIIRANHFHLTIDWTTEGASRYGQIGTGVFVTQLDRVFA